MWKTGLRRFNAISVGLWFGFAAQDVTFEVHVSGVSEFAIALAEKLICKASMWLNVG